MFLKLGTAQKNELAARRRELNKNKPANPKGEGAQPDTKLAKIQAALRAENWADAFRLANGFDRGFTKDQARTVQIAHEVTNSGKGKFYAALGVNTDGEIAAAKDLLKTKYLK